MPIPINPYIAGNPVGNSPAFVGRDDVLREVLRMLRTPTQNATTLYGQRRIGKTSVLQSLEARLPQEGPYLPIFYDLMDKAAWPLSQVLADLARTIARCLGLPEPELKDNAETIFRQVWLPGALQTLPAEASLVLLFDEFDVLADPKSQRAASSFFPYLRDLLALDPARLKFVFVLGRNITDLSSIALSVFKGIPSKRVSLLLEKDAAKLIRLSQDNGSLAWSEAAVSAAWKLTHGHPYLSQALCYQVWELAYEAHDQPPPVQPEDVEAAIPAMLEASRNTFEWLWDGLGPAERVVLAALAQAGEKVVDESELERILRDSGVRILIRELQSAPQLLQDWDLLEPADGGYRFRVEVLRRWITTHRPLNRVQEEMDRVQPLAENLYQSAEGFYRSNDLKQTESLLRQALNVNPNHVRANDLLAELLIARGDLAEVRSLLEKFYEFAPQNARHRLVQVYLQQAESAASDPARRELYEKIIGIDPQQPEACEQLATMDRLEREEQELAFRFVEGRQALQRGEWAKAIEHLRWIVNTRPYYADHDALAADLLADAVRQKQRRLPAWEKWLRQPRTWALLGGALAVLVALIFVGTGVGLSIGLIYLGTQNIGPLHSLATRTPTITFTPTVTPTFTVTAMPTPTDTVTPTPTPTFIPTITDSPTPTLTPTPTNTITPTCTLTPVPTKTDSPTPTSTPTPKAGDTRIRLVDGMVIAFIPAGEFLMGSSENPDESPMHTVMLDAFWMDTHEVTNAMYATCVTKGQCTPPQNTQFYSNTQFTNHPVVYVDWSQANAYCTWAGGRLPTEAEWEKAARGGLENMAYPWGDEAPVCTLGVINGAQFTTCDGDTIATESFAPNGYGLFDMAGNVWEWVSDWYSKDYYASVGDNATNPTGPELLADSRVLRGGSWYSYELDLRVAERDWYTPDNVFDYLGFRCSRSY